MGEKLAYISHSFTFGVFVMNGVNLKEHALYV